MRLTRPSLRTTRASFWISPEEDSTVKVVTRLNFDWVECFCCSLTAMLVPIVVGIAAARRARPKTMVEGPSVESSELQSRFEVWMTGR